MMRIGCGIGSVDFANKSMAIRMYSGMEIEKYF